MPLTLPFAKRPPLAELLSALCMLIVYRSVALSMFVSCTIVLVRVHKMHEFTVQCLTKGVRPAALQTLDSYAWVVIDAAINLNIVQAGILVAEGCVLAGGAGLYMWYLCNKVRYD